MNVGVIGLGLIGGSIALNIKEIDKFYEKYKNTNCLIFGFTSILWKYGTLGIWDFQTMGLWNYCNIEL